MKEVTYTVHIEPAEEGGFWAYVPSLPGCFTQGETLEEVIRMAKEAIEGFVAVLAEHGEPIPVEKHHPRRMTLDIGIKTPTGSMTRLPMVNARKVIAALKQAGFEQVKQHGSHLYFWHPVRKLETVVPIHPGDLGRSLLRAIIQQAGLTEAEFRELL